MIIPSLPGTHRWSLNALITLSTHRKLLSTGVYKPDQNVVTVEEQKVDQRCMLQYYQSVGS